MFEKIKNIFKSEPTPVIPETPVKQPRKSRSKKGTTVDAKSAATASGEPWVSIVRVDVDPNNINAGSFELDWNDKFVINLIKSGYKQRQDDTDQIIVDRWFQTVCRNIALEVYEQGMADPGNREGDELRRVTTRDIGGGRTEIS